jgi:ADP-heptose:LPS heptosyltransferase
MWGESTIVIFAHHGLGDLIMVLPSLNLLMQHHGGSQRVIVVVRGRPERDFLIKMEVGVNPTDIYTIGSASLIARSLRTLTLLIRLYRLGVSYFIPVHIYSTYLARIMAIVMFARRSSVCVISQLDASEHKSVYFAKHFLSLGLFRKVDPLRFPPFKRSSVSGRVSDSRKYLAFCPSVGSPDEQHKNWGYENFFQLANEFCESNAQFDIVFVVPKSDIYCIDLFYSGIVRNPGRTSLAVKDDAFEVLEVLESSSCVLSNCSGAIHMAALVGAKIIGIYGPTDPYVTGAYSSSVEYISLGLGCSPCYSRYYISGCGRPVCMTGITVEQVLSRLLSALDNTVL